jgi:hypothetical protein
VLCSDCSSSSGSSGCSVSRSGCIDGNSYTMSCASGRAPAR